MTAAPDPYRYFRLEARELLDELGRGVLELEKSPNNPALVQQLLRFAHTLKGAARVVKQGEIAELAHSVEEGLAPLRDATTSLSHERADRILRILDEMSVRVGALSVPGAQSAPPSTPQEEVLRPLRADVAELDALLDAISEAYVQLAALERALGPLERTRHLAELVSDQLSTPRPRDAPARPADASKLASMAEELSLTLSRLDRGAPASIEQLARELGSVREAAEELRLVRASALFPALERVARDAGRALGKQVHFHAGGGDVRLDSHVLATVQVALVQLVRNAVAHGIESEAERIAGRKPAVGNVFVEAERHGSRVVFRCRDDGAGVDLDAVRRAAEQKGVPAGEAQGLAPERLLEILLEGGFSTATAVTEVAGRGVGLDVVRTAARELDAQVRVETRHQAGTLIELIVPVSLSSIQALLVEAGGRSAAIPLDSVRRTLRIASHQIARTEQGSSIVFGDRAIPFMRLWRKLGAHPPARRSDQSFSAVVVEGLGTSCAVGIERLRGTARVVVRPLPALAPADPIIAGATLDASGVPQVVLDPDELVRAATEFQQQQAAPPAESRRPILIVDDSLTTRMLEQSILESAGYQTDSAVSAEEALQKARRTRYGLFLVDVEMPGMDGFSFVEQTRGDPVLRDIPSILVTSRSSAQDVRRGAEVGARAYIVKSEFDQATLLQTIRGLVS